MGNVYLCETGIFKNRLAWVMLIYAKQVFFKNRLAWVMFIYAKQVFLKIDLHG